MGKSYWSGRPGVAGVEERWSLWPSGSASRLSPLFCGSHQYELWCTGHFFPFWSSVSLPLTGGGSGHDISRHFQCWGSLSRRGRGGPSKPFPWTLGVCCRHEGPLPPGCPSPWPAFLTLQQSRCRERGRPTSYRPPLPGAEYRAQPLRFLLGGGHKLPNRKFPDPKNPLLLPCRLYGRSPVDTHLGIHPPPLGLRKLSWQAGRCCAAWELGEVSEEGAGVSILGSGRLPLLPLPLPSGTAWWMTCFLPTIRSPRLRSAGVLAWLAPHVVEGPSEVLPQHPDLCCQPSGLAGQRQNSPRPLESCRANIGLIRG